MLRRILKLNNRRSGSAMVFVLILFLITMIIFASVNFIFSSNLKMSVAQEENLRAYYLTLSGIDITKSTLLSTLYVDGAGVEKTMFEKIREAKIASLTDSIDIDGEDVDIEVTYDETEDVITISSTATLKSGNTKHLALELEFSGNQYRERWIR
jgi:type II secretory pathway component PulK